MTKFNEKVFSGKYVWIKVSGYPGIRRRYSWNAVKSRYEDPPIGPLYEARRVEVRGQQPVSRSFSSLQDAREWKERRTPDVEKGIVSTGACSNYTVAHLIRDFKAKRYPFLSEGTIILYDRRLAMLGPLEALPVDSLSPKEITAWVKWLKDPEQMKDGRETRTSFEKELKALSAMLYWHIEESDDSKLVFPIKKKHFEQSQVRRKTQRVVILSDDELEKWLVALREQDPFFYKVAFVQVSQLFRVCEVAAMKWSNLDMLGKRYHVKEHVIWPRVGGRPARLVPGTKTSLETYLTPLRQEAFDLLLTVQRSQSDLIFTTDGRLLTYRQIQHAYDRAFEAAGLPHRGTHVCRHTGSTRFLDQTQDLLALQQLGDWKNQHMPQHYAKIRSGRAEMAMREAEKRLKLVANNSNEGEQVG